VLRREVDRQCRRRQPYLQIGILGVEIRKTRDEPSLRERRIGLDRQDVPTAATRHAKNCAVDMLKCLADAVKQLPAVTGQLDASVRALEQDHAEIFLENAHLAAYGN